MTNKERTTINDLESNLLKDLKVLEMLQIIYPTEESTHNEQFTINDMTNAVSRAYSLGKLRAKRKRA